MVVYGPVKHFCWRGMIEISTLADFVKGIWVNCTIMYFNGTNFRGEKFSRGI